MRSVAAVLAGFVAMAALVMVATLAVAALLPTEVGDAPGALYLVVNLAYSALAAVVGGWVAARLACAGASRSVLTLALLVGAAGVWSALGAPPQVGQPSWYPWALTLLGPAGVLGGGFGSRARQTRGHARWGLDAPA
jgi:hypothetical protein